MDIDSLRYFAGVAKTGSITKAAKHLFLSQQGLNKAIGAMDQVNPEHVFCGNGAADLIFRLGVITMFLGALLAIAGLVLNVAFGLGIWDYSHLWGNLWGQICPQFSALWCGLCLIFIPVFDWLRYAVTGGERPRYYLAFGGA